MKHKAIYLDFGFYVISDAAAGALVRVLGQKLPKQGWEKFVMIRTEKGAFNAWLKRTNMRHCLRTDINHERGWRWALHGIRRDGAGCVTAVGALEAPNFGKAFTFEAVASTQAVAA